jgi:hypothetical protein
MLPEKGWQTPTAAAASATLCWHGHAHVPYEQPDWTWDMSAALCERIASCVLDEMISTA